MKENLTIQYQVNYPELTEREIREIDTAKKIQAKAREIANEIFADIDDNATQYAVKIGTVYALNESKNAPRNFDLTIK